MKIKFELLTKLSKNIFTQRQKIFLSTSIGWIILIGYLTWLNGVNDLSFVKTFQWGEWFWLGIIPATIPYVFYYIWKKPVTEEENKEE